MASAAPSGTCKQLTPILPNHINNAVTLNGRCNAMCTYCVDGEPVSEPEALVVALKRPYLADVSAGCRSGSIICRLSQTGEPVGMALVFY